MDSGTARVAGYGEPAEREDDQQEHAAGRELDQGRLVAEGTPEQLKRHIPGGHVQLRPAGAAQLGAAVRVLRGSTPDGESLAAKTQESAGFSTVPLIMLPFFSSAIVPADKMGAGIREFAHYQPFTSMIESIRGFFIGAPNTGQTLAAIAWSLGITVVGYIWARSKFNTQA